MRWMKPGLAVLLSVCVVGCVNDTEARKRDAQKFLQSSTGEYVDDAGDTLFIAPVYARMIGFDTFFVERNTPRGLSQRIISLEPSRDGEKLVQLSFVFTQPAQWRDVREHPELLTALQPQDLRPAGTCDIKMAEDLNSLTYSCGGGAVTNYHRVQHNVPD